jgi:hypothetical protein
VLLLDRHRSFHRMDNSFAVEEVEDIVVNCKDTDYIVVSFEHQYCRRYHFEPIQSIKKRLKFIFSQ